MTNNSKIQLATLLPGADLLTETTKNPVWKAPVKLLNGDTTFVYLKLLEKRQLFIESLCAIIGRAVGIPIPEPLIVKVPASLVSSLTKCDGPTEDLYAFGSVDADYPSLNRVLNIDDGSVVWDKLREHSKSLEAAIFDEWIANGDRHWGNLLYDGGDDFIFIDHDLALSSSINIDEGIEKNLLFNFITDDIDELSKARILKKLDEEIRVSYEKVDITDFVELCFGSSFICENSIDEITNFLIERINKLSVILRKKLNPEQGDLLECI
ncbi:HipA family kinase [Grimontia sp. NTOU-MAR1]|uniref:HipA family kinase n=1 Tax=Grimontia sp. NTOU-MAR1 TaxID=3111011 RepID=UPI002DBA6A07|nr:HipA family kinase [Grimontia sp. NTOU-MAR1]WRV96261.1 HipA family kinase [Grimontia sp. NTOU-MAR1]